MGSTEIEWASKVWNFTRGCRRVSAGCGGAAGEGGCYAERQAYRFSSPGQPYEGLVRMGKHGPQWTGKGRFVAEKLAEPLRWRTPKNGSRMRIFVNSMSDLFFEAFSNEQIAAAFGVMATCPQHDFLILTKRPSRMLDWFAWVNDGHPMGPAHEVAFRAKVALDVDGSIIDRAAAWPLPNVWLGVSAEDQATADERIPALLETPAAVRFVSYEPALGPLDLGRRCFLGQHGGRLGHDEDGYCKDCDGGGTERGVDWVIVGGESGPGARPFDLAWAELIVSQCKAAGVPVFVKQLGAWAHDSVERLTLKDRKGGDINEFPEALRVREFPR